MSRFSGRFNAGYWHSSPPTPWTLAPSTLKQYKKLGMPDIDAPTGGRAMIIRSTDVCPTEARKRGFPEANAVKDFVELDWQEFSGTALH